MQQNPEQCFNRTFMELKLEGSRLLLPLIIGFNRTFMELKFVTLPCLAVSPLCFNRTFMELKYSHGYIYPYM